MRVTNGPGSEGLLRTFATCAPASGPVPGIHFTCDAITMVGDGESAASTAPPPNATKTPQRIKFRIIRAPLSSFVRVNVPAAPPDSIAEAPLVSLGETPLASLQQCV